LQISSKLESNTSELELKLISEMKDMRIYSQANIKASRKMILPLISSINFESNSENVNKQNEKQDKGIFDKLILISIFSYFYCKFNLLE
jgi:hypothetical protein